MREFSFSSNVRFTASIALVLAMLGSSIGFSSAYATDVKTTFYAGVVDDAGSTRSSLMGGSRELSLFNTKLTAVSSSGKSSLWQDDFGGSSVWLLKRNIGNDVAVIPGSTARKLTSVVALSEHIVVTKFRKHFISADISGDTTDLEFSDLGTIPKPEAGFKRVVNSVSAIGTFAYVSTTDYQTGTEPELGHSKLWLLRPYDDPEEIEDSADSYISALISSTSSGGEVHALRIHLTEVSQYSVENVSLKRDGDLEISNSGEKIDIASYVSKLKFGWANQGSDNAPVIGTLDENIARVYSADGQLVRNVRRAGLSDLFISTNPEVLSTDGDVFAETEISSKIDLIPDSVEVKKGTDLSSQFRVVLYGNEYRFIPEKFDLDFYIGKGSARVKVDNDDDAKITKSRCYIVKFNGHVGIKNSTLKTCFEVQK